MSFSLRVELAVVVLLALASNASGEAIDLSINYGLLDAESSTGDDGSSRTPIGGLLSIRRHDSDAGQQFVETRRLMRSGSPLIQANQVGIAAFCLDLLNELPTGMRSYQSAALGSADGSSGLTADQANAVSALWRQFVNPDVRSSLSAVSLGQLRAAQIAIWEVVYGSGQLTSQGLSPSGALQGPEMSGLFAEAGRMLAWVDANPEAPKANLNLLISSDGPQLVVESMLAEPLVVVPEQGNFSSLILIVAVIAVYAGRYRKRPPLLARGI